MNNNIRGKGISSIVIENKIKYPLKTISIKIHLIPKYFPPEINIFK